MRGIFLTLLCFSANCHADFPLDLCTPAEKIVFSCTLGAKTASICASPDLTETSGYVQYRFGTDKQLELVYPKTLLPPKAKFFFSSTAYAGGDADRIRFKIAGFDYVVFHSMIRTNFKPGEPNDPQESAGLVTRSKGNYGRPRKCDNFIAGDAAAYGYFDKEPFDDTLTP